MLKIITNGLIIYYICFGVAFIFGIIENKKDFWKGLIPFYGLVILLYGAYKELE